MEESNREEVFTKDLLMSKGKEPLREGGMDSLLSSQFLNVEGQHLPPNPKVATDTPYKSL